MTDRTPDDSAAPADRTRDIRLPPLADRPGPVLPEEWTHLRSEAESGEGEPGTAAADERLARQRTDELSPPPGATPRERTLAFSSPEMRHRPIEPVQVGSTARRWPWVVLALVPVLLIVGSAIAWLLLLEGV